MTGPRNPQVSHGPMCTSIAEESTSLRSESFPNTTYWRDFLSPFVSQIACSVTDELTISVSLSWGSLFRGHRSVYLFLCHFSFVVSFEVKEHDTSSFVLFLITLHLSYVLILAWSTLFLLFSVCLSYYMNTPLKGRGCFLCTLLSLRLLTQINSK